MPEGEIRVADVGSGAGFPGIPIKIIRPEVEMYLIEPSGKKSTFLGYMIQKLKLVEIDVIEKRIEDIRIRHELAQSVDVAVTRALFTVKEFVKKTSHILKTGGILILSKGPKGIEEIKGLGDITYHLMDLKLPLSDIMRHMIVVKR
jgi:16S rRNA (guanine527-N7)-methyltransferase